MQGTELPLVETRAEKLFATVSSSVKQLRAAYNETFTALYATELALADTRGTLSNIEQSYQLLQHSSASAELEAAAEIQSLVATRLDLLGKLSELESRYALVCSAISPTHNPSVCYDKFKALVELQLLPLLNRINVVPNEAEQVMKIRAMDDELRLAASFNAFTERTIVAVAGSFSSGKSSFISSLFETDKVSLPVGIEPVTAIPTYILHADELKITGYPLNGGCFDIPAAVYARLSHQFVDEFGFNLRDLLPFMSLEVPLRSYRDLAFIDLPGHNPGDRDGVTRADRATSQEFMTQAHALIWMIGLDVSGNIPADDLDHLWDLAENNIPLYLVLNKADLRPAVTLDEVLDQVAEELMMAGIHYEGLCAYSSEDGGELQYRERSLWQVLTEWDKPRQAMAHIVDKLEEVLSDYEAALQHDVAQRQQKSGFIKTLELNLLELGAFEDSDVTGFNLNNYMTNTNDTDTDPEDDSTTESSGLFGSYAALFMGTKTPENKSKKPTRVKESTSEVVAEKQPEQMQRATLINNVKEQIEALRDDYRTEQTEKDLAELRQIRSKLNTILLA